MDDLLHTLDIATLKTLSTHQQQDISSALEKGKVVYLPQHYFTSSLEHLLLTETLLDHQHKNISFNYLSKQLSGYNKKHPNLQIPKFLLQFMHGYAEFAQKLVTSLFPHYQPHLIWGRTSYRPAEIRDRVISKRKDDTRLHVDSFAATPVNGLRILRVFCNINPYEEPRVWHLGEPFAQVLQRYAPQITTYKPILAKLLKAIKVTRTLRSAYDHYQLQLHDTMKLDDHYQNTVTKTQINFPAHSSWIVFTDQVSHAALSGQFLLEQTFYIPVSAMQAPHFSPLKLWEKEKACVLA